MKNKYIHKKWMIAVIGVLICLSAQAQNYMYGPEIDNWNEKIKAKQRENGKEFLDLLKSAKEGGLKEINLEHDHYRFQKSFSHGNRGHIFAEGLSGLTINGNGAEFWFEDYGTAINLRDCENVTFNNISIDYDPVPQAQGIITKIGDKFLEIKNEKGFPTCTEIKKKAGNSKSKVFVFDDETNLFKREVPHIVGNKFEDIGDNNTRITGRAYGGYDFNKEPNIEMGDKVCVVFHMGHGIRLNRCYNVTLDGVNMYASTQYGVISTSGGGFKMINSNIIQRPGTERLMTCNQDGIHFMSNEIGPHIENCKFSGMADDVMNIHSEFDLIQQQLEPGKALIAIRNFMVIEEGDTLNIYDGKTYRKKTEAKVIDIQSSDKPEFLEEAKNIGKEFGAHFWNGEHSMIVSFDRPVNVKRGDVVENPSKGSYDTYVGNNKLYNSTTRGMMIKVKDAIVENNHLENIAVCGILTFGSLEWFEAVFHENVTIRNNTLIGIGHSMNSRRAGQKKMGAICAMVEYFGSLKQGIYNAKEITIQNNYIEDTPLAGIFIAHVDGAKIKGNTIKDYNNAKLYKFGEDFGVKPLAGIFIADSKNIQLEKNKITDPGVNAKKKVIYGPYYEPNK
jgi:polygalacturonase